MNYNKVIIGGKLTRDPELRFTPKGSAICAFGVAVNRSWKSEGGEKKDEVTFIDIECFGKQAETVSQYFKKGRGILLDGRLKLDTWEKDGKKNQKLKVVLESFSFVESRGEQSTPKSEPAGALASAEAPTPLPVGDDVPF